MAIRLMLRWKLVGSHMRNHAIVSKNIVCRFWDEFHDMPLELLFLRDFSAPCDGAHGSIRFFFFQAWKLII